MDPLTWSLWILCGLAVLSIVLGTIESRIKPPAGTQLPNGLKPGLAAELARSREDIERIVGPSETKEGKKNRSLLRWLEILDLPFIAAYTSLFFLLGQLESTLAFPGASVLGLGSRATVLIAGLADLLEDIAILRTLRGNEGSVRRFGLTKWFFYYLTLAGLSLLFFFFPATGGVEHCLSPLTGGLFLLAGLGGVAAVLLRKDRWLPAATAASALGLLLLLVLLIFHKRA
jgi:hypothetical protein